MHFAFALARVLAAFGRALAQFLQSDWNAHTLAVPQNLEHDLRSRLFLSDQHLKFAGIAHFLAVDFSNNVADLQASFRSRRIWFDLRDHSACGYCLVEELRVFGSHIRDSDSDVTVADFTVADQSLHRGPDNLRWNGKSHSREAARRRNQKGIDPDDFAASIHQRPARVAGIDGRVRLDELAGLAGIGRVRIRPVHRAHDAARYREAKSIGIAEGQHGLTRPRFFRIAPRSTGQIGGVHLQHRQVSQRIRPHQFRFQHATIAGSHANVDRAIDHMVIGHDVAIGRNHHAAAHAVLNLRLALLHVRTKELTKRAALSKKLLHVFRHLSARGFCLGSRGDGDVDDCRGNPRRQRFHRLVESQQ